MKFRAYHHKWVRHLVNVTLEHHLFQKLLLLLFSVCCNLQDNWVLDNSVYRSREMIRDRQTFYNARSRCRWWLLEVNFVYGPRSWRRLQLSDPDECHFVQTSSSPSQREQLSMNHVAYIVWCTSKLTCAGYRTPELRLRAVFRGDTFELMFRATFAAVSSRCEEPS